MKSMAGNGISILIIMAIMVLQGCSFMGIGKSDYACPGGIDGVRCMSARQVYQATETSDYVKTISESEEDKSDEKNNQIIGFPRPHGNLVAVPSIGQSIPIRTQAEVMRIWMAPWEDDDGDLHADGYLYTEIRGRQWNLGDRFKAPAAAFSPLSISTPAKDAK